MVCYRRRYDHIKILTHTFPTCHLPAENFSVSPEPQGEIQTISCNIQGSHLPFQSYLSVAFSRCPKLICHWHSAPHSAFLSSHLSVSFLPLTPTAPALNSQGAPVCSARVLYTHYHVTLFHSCHLSRCHLTIIFSKARKVLYLCTPTAPGPENLQSESPFLSILPAKGYT